MNFEKKRILNLSQRPRVNPTLGVVRARLMLIICASYANADTDAIVTFLCYSL